MLARVAPGRWASPARLSVVQHGNAPGSPLCLTEINPLALADRAPWDGTNSHIPVLFE